jgi:hypothetical protein
LLPHPSVYKLEVLTSNLKILQQMTQNVSERPTLLETLDPRIRWHLKKADTRSLKRVQTMVRLELLLHAAYDQDERSIGTLLNELGSAGANIASVLLKEHTGRKERIQAVQGLLADLYATAEEL